MALGLSGLPAGIPVCLNPAYRRWLTDVTAGLAPVFAEVAGLPGAPVRATQVAASYPGGDGGPPQVLTLGGQPPELHMSLGPLDMPGPCGFCSGPVPVQQFAQQMQMRFARAFVGGGADAGTPVQAVQAALLQGVGMPFAEQPAVLGSTDKLPPPGTGSATGPVYIAAQPFANMPAAERDAWLAAHLAALRTGQLTLGDLP